MAVAAMPSAMTSGEAEEASADNEELIALRNSTSKGSWDKVINKQYTLMANEGHLGIVGTKQKL